MKIGNVQTGTNLLVEYFQNNKYRYVLFHSSLPYSRSLAPNQDSAEREREMDFAHAICFPRTLIDEPKTQSVSRVSKCQNCRKQKSMRFQTRRLF